jgi:hypothetical protein
MEVQFQMPPTGFKRLFYDIETSPNIGLFWQSGYKLNIDHSNIIQERAIICICWKWEGQKEVHCKKDVDLLEQVFHRLQPFITHNHHAGEKGGFGRYSCPKCGHDNPTYQKMRVTKAGTKRHQLSCKSGCGYFTVSNAVWMQKLKAEIEEKIATANM